MFGRIILKTFEFRRSVPRSLNLQRDYVVYVKLCSYADVLPRITVHGNGLCRNSFQTSATTFKVRKTREERQNKNIIQFKPKSKHPILELWPGITIAEISKLSQRSLSQVFEALSYIATGVEYQRPSSEIMDRVMILELAKKLGYKVSFIKKPGEESEKSETVNDLFRGPKPEPKDLVKRPPVVTIMGHVDHGKTTLLDSLRNTSVAAQEYGGITQHIGAFTVHSSGGVITFLDTPGHAAFQAMRSRGAHATDIVVLVVAADDGIMEQTLESVRFAREANVPIIVAINKIDKAQANIEQIKRDLLTCGLQVEELGGEVQAVCISALKKTNLSSLIETILTQAEVMEISGDPESPVEGIVLETSMDKGKGKISTALVQRGTLKKGVYLVAGTSWAKVRSMFDNRGKVVTEAMPGIPVQVTGWKSLPQAGDVILQAESEKHAQRVVKYRETLQKSEKSELDSIVIQKKLEQHLEKYRAERQERLMKGRYRKERKYHRDKEIAIDTDPYLAFVLKGDVHGSVEAIVDVLSTYKSHDDCRLDMVHYAVGDVTENDIVLAESFEGIVYCFNVHIPPAINQLAIDKNVPIKSFNVIYHLIDDLKVEINKRLPLLKEEDILGEAEVLQEFLINEGKKKVHVAGCKCVKGLLKRGTYCKVLRSKEVLYSGSIQSLKHEKTDVDSIKKDVQCGLRLENPDFSFSPGDTILCFEEKYVPRTTDWDPGF